jgi:imidazolonepropionase-like amidohydrolase
MRTPIHHPAHTEYFTVHTSTLFDAKRKAFVQDISIRVDPATGLILKTYKRDEELAAQIQEPDIDLRGKTVLPGFVDAHTHIFLHDYSEASSLYQMRDESFVERVVRATNHCRVALLAGYTTYRDLGTEGLGSADVNFRDTVNRGIIPGPRLFVATEAIASSGGYEIRSENTIMGITVPRISDPADGSVGVRAAVRRRIGAGADIIKFYADYRKRTLRFPPPTYPGGLDIQFPPVGIVHIPPPPVSRNLNTLLFTQEEMDIMVAEAKVSKAPCAAHCSSTEAVVMAAKAGVTSVEHGNESFSPDNDALKALLQYGTIYVPTLSTMSTAYTRIDFVELLAHTKKAFDMGVKMACGGDTGAFAHGENVRELELFLEAGIPLPDVLQAATLHGWEACGGDLCGRRFGLLEEGFAADIIALDGDPREHISALRRVDTVIKDGKIWKCNAKAVNMV